MLTTHTISDTSHYPNNNEQEPLSPDVFPPDYTTFLSPSPSPSHSHSLSSSPIPRTNQPIGMARPLLPSCASFESHYYDSPSSSLLGSTTTMYVPCELTPNPRHMPSYGSLSTLLGSERPSFYDGPGTSLSKWPQRLYEAGSTVVGGAEGERPEDERLEDEVRFRICCVM
jgi:hypothetical protein